MVAYSFQARFVAPIQAGTKFQTIRAERKRHARSGEELQLYHGMRTRNCFLIGRPICVFIEPIRLYLRDRMLKIGGGAECVSDGALNVFARRDGFADWDELVAFWREHHPEIDTVFSGVLIRWGPFSRP